MQIQQETPPGIHAEPSIPPAQDEEYGDFIVKHGQNMGGKFLPVNELFGILYIPLNEIGPLEINSYTYASLPKCYTFMDADALNSSGITRLHNHPYLKLQGEGTVIAVIDSGIDYLNPIFRNGDVSRIAYIWDQTIPGNEDEQVPYGKVFTGEEINQALLSEKFHRRLYPHWMRTDMVQLWQGWQQAILYPQKILRSSSESNDHCGEIKESKILSEKILPVSATGTGISGRRHYAGDFFCSEDGTRDGNAGFRLSGTWHQSERTCW